MHSFLETKMLNSIDEHIVIHIYIRGKKGLLSTFLITNGKYITAT